MTHTFTAVFEPADEGGYAAFVEELPGANAQGASIEEARENLQEAIELTLACGKGYRIPEPTRQADILADRAKSQGEQGKQGVQGNLFS